VLKKGTVTSKTKDKFKAISLTVPVEYTASNKGTVRTRTANLEVNAKYLL
jgi:hypothetical protein